MTALLVVLVVIVLTLVAAVALQRRRRSGHVVSVDSVERRNRDGQRGSGA